MYTQHFELRGHHLLNLVSRLSDNYQNLSDGLSRITRSGDVAQRAYSDNDIQSRSEFYQTITDNQNNTISVVAGVDDICKLCSNYDNQRCSLFSSEKLDYEDTRSLKDFFPSLVVGDTVTVSDVFSSFRKST